MKFTSGDKSRNVFNENFMLTLSTAEYWVSDSNDFVCQKYSSKFIPAWFSIRVHSQRRQSSMESVDDVEIWPHSVHKGYALTIEPS